MYPGSAIFVGFFGAFVYYGSSMLLKYMEIDDPLEACPVHGFCGLWGVLAAGLFSNDRFISEAYGDTYGGTGRKFGKQLLGAFVILVWTLGTSAFMFLSIHYILPGGIRVSEEDELAGLDAKEHGGQ